MKKLIAFNLHPSLVDLVFSDGSHAIIYLNQDSGKTYYRLKINTISNVKHTGIYLGQDEFGINYFMHNHYLVGQPSLSTEENFRKGQRLYLNNNSSANSALTIINNALQAIIKGEKYNSLTYNCQSFTSEATNNFRHSPDVEKWKGLAAFGILALAFIAIIRS